ncbi:MAG: hypothetical protein ACFFE8_03030 [Candidatus Heimdallarchaeota archaeon]
MTSRSPQIVLLGQIRSSLNLITQVIEKCPQRYWFHSRNEWSLSWALYHVIETLDFYLREDPRGMEWGDRIGIKWDSQTQDEIQNGKSQITKDFLADFLLEIEEKASQTLKSVTDIELLSQDGFKWFETRLEKYIYAIRHTVFHIGECNKALRDKNSPRIEWQ